MDFSISKALRMLKGIFLDGMATKLVLVVRMDAGMKKGKIASQCAHAAVGCYREATLKSPGVLRLWEAQGQPKIVLKSDVNGEECLQQLFQEAKKLGLVTVLVKDAGRTQVEEGSITVLGIGPGKTSLVDQITNKLKLL